MRASTAFGCAIALAAACARPPDPGRDAPPAPDPLATLRAFEAARRSAAAFLEEPPQDRAFGADPYDVAVLPDGRVVGVLRGRDAIVLLDPDLREVARAPAPRAPGAVAVLAGATAGALRAGDILVASEIAPSIACYRVVGARLERLAEIPLGDVSSVRDVATGPEGVVYAVEEHGHRLLELRLSGSGIERHERPVPRGPIRVVRAGRALVVLSLLDHRITVWPVDRRGLTTGTTTSAAIDGPFWGFDATAAGADVLVLAGGVEDRPLDRTGGFFGNVDSFVYGYRWRGDTLERTFARNVSEEGVVVPKAIAFDRSAPPGERAFVTGYGGARALRVDHAGTEAPAFTALDAMPGTSALASTARGFVAANPLLDAWVLFDRAGARVALRRELPDGDTRSDRERLGEALFFTELIAPASSSEGPRSRFTCETCHFEGYVDGRVHHTGRGDVRATTKPLVGLFNNRPHFSRALDPDLSAVAENEFRVAGAPSSSDPHFDLAPALVPWLADLGVEPRPRDATELRLSLIAFLIRWSHRTNPRAVRTGAFGPEARLGATLFRDRCEGCHQARAAADEPASRLPFERWESLVLAENGPIVWGSNAYERTGVEPYVHEQGARVPSLRRLYKKRPYFTNGSAPDLGAVLRRARFGVPGFRHDGTNEGVRLDETEAAALEAFLDLL